MTFTTAHEFHEIYYNIFPDSWDLHHIGEKTFQMLEKTARGLILGYKISILVCILVLTIGLPWYGDEYEIILHVKVFTDITYVSKVLAQNSIKAKCVIMMKFQVIFGTKRSLIASLYTDSSVFGITSTKMSSKLNIRKGVYNLVGRMPKSVILRIFEDQNISRRTIYRTSEECE